MTALAYVVGCSSAAGVAGDRMPPARHHSDCIDSPRMTADEDSHTCRCRLVEDTSRTYGERTGRAGLESGPVAGRSSSGAGRGEGIAVPCRGPGTEDIVTGTRLGRRSGRDFLPCYMQAEPRGLRGLRGPRRAWLVTQPADDRCSSCRLGRYCFAGAITDHGLVVAEAEATDTELLGRCHSGETQSCSEAPAVLEIRSYRRSAMRFD